MLRKAVFLTTLLSCVAHADEEVLHTRGWAMGGAVAAHPEDNSALTVNPASLALKERYVIQAHFGLQPGLNPQWAATVVDSKTNANYALGFGYRGQRLKGEPALSERPGWIVTGQSPEVKRRTDDFLIGIGIPVFERRLSFGLGGLVTYYRHDVLGEGLTGNAHVGVSGSAGEVFTWGISGRNLIPFNNQPTHPARVQAGVRVGSDIASASLDGDYQLEQVDSSPLSLHVGGEVSPGQTEFIAGYEYDGPLATHQIGWAFGWVSETASFTYGMRIPVGEKLAAGDLMHRVAFRLKTGTEGRPSMGDF